jgi:hypothetical protein
MPFVLIVCACVFFTALVSYGGSNACVSDDFAVSSLRLYDASQPASDSEKAGGYSQPASRKQVWFDAAALGGFKQVPFLTGALVPSGPQHDKWIVVTTINEPTDAVKKLAALSEWRVVVIGDTKTPPSWAWQNVVYLSIDAQIALGFSTTQLIRTRAYTRKNVGYLYAILHGATIIYETDDDNALTVSAIPLVGSGRGVERVLEFTARGLTINHHAHFGQPSTWPRGYPLEAIGEPHVSRVKLASVVPAVQQGLANGDPDMDAIFRLTRKPVDKRIDFEFKQVRPVALPFGSFAPYNAQNTVFTYEGLWATVLPQTVEFRVCDIWRAFYTQRLLWGTGAQLVFVSPYVYQLRNAHSYHGDYLSEKQIFDQVAEFLAWLKAWSCPTTALEEAKGATSALPACAYALARDMAISGYWGPADAELVRHFFYDLARIGYKFPAWTEQPKNAYVHACSSAGTCEPDGAPIVEKVTSNPSSTLYGTCEVEVPPSAVFNADRLVAV